MTILVVGAGATGGYFGTLLAQAGRDVTFLVRRIVPSNCASAGCGSWGRGLEPDAGQALRPNLVMATRRRCSRRSWARQHLPRLSTYTAICTRATWTATRTGSTLPGPPIRPESGQVTTRTNRPQSDEGDDLRFRLRPRRDSNPNLLIRRDIRTLSWPACCALTGQDAAQQCAAVVGLWARFMSKIRPAQKVRSSP